MIRDATAADLPKLRAIQQTALDEPWPDLLSTVGPGSPLILVAESSTPVGYAVAIPGTTETYLAELAVEPQSRRNGYGSELLDAVLSRATGRVELTVQESDDEVRDFYDSHDFELSERLEDYFKNGAGLLLVRDSSE